MRMDPCVLGTVCIPWTEDYSFHERLFRQEIRYLVSHGLENLYIFGTAGEGYGVTTGLYRKIASVFFEEMRSSPGIRQLGIIAMSVDQVKERIEIGLEIGFEQFQISLPSWCKLSDVEVRRFFDDVLGAYPQARFLHYNTPRGLRVLTGAEYARIAADHTNLVATKSLGSAFTTLELMNRAPELCHFFGEMNFGYASLFGSCGLLASVSTLNPKKSLELWQAGRARDSQALIRLSLEVRQALEVIYECLGHDRIDSAYDKAYCKCHIPEFPLRLLSPYQGMSDSEYAELISSLARRLPDWFKQD